MTLHDINPPIEMVNETLLYVLGAVVFGVFVLLFRYFYQKRKKTTHALDILKRCDYQDAKKTALQFSYYGKKLFLKPKEKAHFITLQKELERYKYLPLTTPLPKALEASIKKLLEQQSTHHA